MRRNVPKAPLLAPQPKARERPSAAEEQHAKKQEAYYTYTYIYIMKLDEKALLGPQQCFFRKNIIQDPVSGSNSFESEESFDIHRAGFAL